MSDKRIKVTDRRMFTPDGELREEYKEALAEEKAEKKDPTPSAAESPEHRSDESRTAPPPTSPAAPVENRAAQPAEGPAPAEEEPQSESGATFEDLVALLAQSASVYLSQAAQHIENRSEHLELARMHVDLLGILKRKTQGNLKPGEEAMLEQVLAQLRMAFVQNA